MEDQCPQCHTKNVVAGKVFNQVDYVNPPTFFRPDNVPFYAMLVSWGRDHVHTLKAYKYFMVDVKSGLDYWLETQEPNGMVWDMYSDVPSGTPAYEFTFGTDQCGNYGGEGDCYNREHSWPKSWFGGEVSPMYSDLFALYPCDAHVNGNRGVYPYGEVGIPDWGTSAYSHIHQARCMPTAPTAYREFSGLNSNRPSTSCLAMAA